MSSNATPMVILCGLLASFSYIYFRYLITPLVKQAVISRKCKSKWELSNKGDAIARNTASYRNLASKILVAEHNTFSASQAFILERTITRISSKGLMSNSQLSIWLHNNMRQAFKPIIFS